MEIFVALGLAVASRAVFGRRWQAALLANVTTLAMLTRRHNLGQSLRERSVVPRP